MGRDSGSYLCCWVSKEVPEGGWTRSVPPEVIPAPGGGAVRPQRLAGEAPPGPLWDLICEI